MPNPRPRKKPAFTDQASWINSGPDWTPRQPAIEHLKWGFGEEEIPGGRRTEEISLGLRLPRRATLPQIMKAIGPIITWVLFETSNRKRNGQSLAERYERSAVVRAWKDGSARKRTQTRDYISEKTRIPAHRVKIILRDWRAVLKVWESSAGVKAQRRMKRDLRRGKHIDSRLLDPAMRFIILGKRASDLSYRLS